MVESLNKKIARLLGKRGHEMKPPPETRNFTFWFIMLVVILFLWVSTGFYYLSENIYGVVLNRGEFSRVIKGLKVGLIKPYPFERVILIDASASYLQYFDYNVKLPDLKTIGVKVQFVYQVTDPKMFYMSYLHNNSYKFTKELRDILRDQITASIKKSINQNVIKDDYHEIMTKNLTIMSHDIKNQVNQTISKYGVSVIKLNIVNVHLINQLPNTVNTALVDSKITASAPSNNIVASGSARSLFRSVNRNVVRMRKY